MNNTTFYIFKPQNKTLLSSANNNKIILKNKCVYINKTAAETYCEKNSIYWENADEKGCIWLYHNGFSGDGFIEKDGVREEILVQAEDAKYSLNYTNANHKDISFELYIGTRYNPDSRGFLEYGSLYFNKNKVIESFPCDDKGNILPDKSDNGFFRTSIIDGHLHAELDLSSIWVLGEEMVHNYIGDDFNLWSGSIDFSMDYNSITGKINEQKTDSSGVIGKGTEYNVIGNVCPSQEMQETQESNSFISTERMSKLKNSFSMIGDAPKSITELYTLKAPNMADANRLAVQTLYYLMVYYTADQTYDCKGTKIKWSSWFGMTKDKARELVIDTSSDILNLVEGSTAKKEVQDFLQKYAKASLSNSYSSSSDKTLEDALSGAKSRLSNYNYCTLPDLCSFYLEGDGEQCLAKDIGYCIAIEEINKYTYAKLTPGLIKYINDPNGGWAEKLYKQCLSNLQQLRITALSGSDGRTEISHKTMMLTILDNSKHDIEDGVDGKEKVAMTYGGAIYAKVFNLQLADLANSMGIEFISKDSGYFVELMRSIYGVIWEELQKDASDYFSKDILKQFQEEQKKYADLTKEEFIQTCIDMTEEGMELIANGSSIAALIPKLGSLSQKPWAAYTATICSIVFYATSIASLSTVFMNWDKSSLDEKIEAILTCVQGVANIALSFVKIKDIKILLDSSATFEEKANAALRLRFDGSDMTTIKGLAKANGEEFNITMENMAKRYNIDVLNPEGEAVRISKITRFFRVAEIAARILNILMMGFITVMSAIEISKEVKEGGYNISVYLEIISTSFMGISLICEAVGFVLDIIGITCSVLPIIGAVAAFAGIIFQIVAGALKKAVNPVVEFIKYELVPFLNSLTIPSEEWVKKHYSLNKTLMSAAIA